MDARRQRQQLVLELRALLRQGRSVHPNAGTLDVGQHVDERELEVAVDAGELLGLEQRLQLARQLPRHVHPLAGELQHGLRREL